jgi:outer membrane protein OmpA-like peptidoglycan-associated protein
MSKARYIYRRISRKTATANVPTHGQQQSSSFFDFGGEDAFFSVKSQDGGNVNRKCESCDKEEKVQKKENASGKTISSGVSSQVKSLQGGNALPSSARNFFEPKFGANFSNVKVHNDSQSNELASSVNARAFTYKDNIVFNKGQYDTETDDGKHLLAHELTHVVQQNPSVSKKENDNKEDEKIQRVPVTSQFDITGKDPSTATDDTIIRFDKGETAVSGPELAKIKKDATTFKGKEINLNGFTSEEGSDEENKRVANARVNHVSNLLAAEGQSGIRHKKPDIVAGRGNPDYRSRRIVEITPTFTPLGVAVPSAIDPCTTRTVPCGTAFSDITGLALQKVIKSVISLLFPTAASTTQVNTFFGATPASTVVSNLNALIGEMTTLISAHNPATDCRKDICDETCSKGANAYVDRNLVPTKMIFCEKLLAAPQDKRAETFIHESLHATPGVLTKDIAYAHTRKILTLSDAEKLKNTDSYVMLIRMLHNPAATPTTPPSDVIGGAVSGPEKDFAKKIIAFMEQWLISSKFISGQLYGKVNDAINTPAGWKSPVSWNQPLMHDLTPVFGLTDPGTVMPFILPTVDDRTRLAGISDRYFRMREVLHSSPITLIRSSTGTEAWAAGLGSTVDVLPSFFAMSEVDAVKHLILLMLKSMNDVPSALESLYVQGADKIRSSSSVGP